MITVEQTTELTQQDCKIAELSAEWYTIEEIAGQTWHSTKAVQFTLEQPNIQNYIKYYSQRLDMGLQVKRIKSAHIMLPQIVQGIQTILDTKDAKKWSMVDFKFMEMMMKQLEKAEQKAFQFNLMINNTWETKEKTIDKETWSELDKILTKLPLKYINLFWLKSLEYAHELYNKSQQDLWSKINLQYTKHSEI